MPDPNTLLRAARERTPSWIAPGHCLSRAELAEAVNAYLWNTTGRRYELSGHHVAKWERGVVRYPIAPYRAGLREILGVHSDAELGLRPATRSPSVASVDRRDFVKVAAGLGVAGVLTGRGGIGAATDEQASDVAGITAHYRRLEGQLHTDTLAPAVAAHRDLVVRIARARPGPARFAVLAEINGLSAWLAADRGDTGTARRRYTEAVSAAERAGQSLLPPYMLGSLGHFAVESGDAREGLSLIDRAASLLDHQAPDTARAWLASLRAAAHASLGDRPGTQRALAEADRHVVRRVDEPRWPWVFAFDAAKAAVYRGTALVRLGDRTGARSALAAAEPALRTPKTRASSLVDRACVHAADGDIGEGARLATEALSIAHRYGSERITGRVRAFRRSLPARTAEIAELDEALAELYAAP